MGELTARQHQLAMLDLVAGAARDGAYSYFLAYGTLLGAVRHQGFIPWDTDTDIYILADEADAFLSHLRESLPEEYEVAQASKESDYPYLFPRLIRQGTSHINLHLDIFVLSTAPANAVVRQITAKLCYLLFRLYAVKNINLRDRFNHSLRMRIVGRLLKVMLCPIPSRLILKAHKRIAFDQFRYSSGYLFNACGSYGKREVVPRTWFTHPEKLPFENLELEVPAAWDDYLRHMYGDYMTPRQTDYLS